MTGVAIAALATNVILPFIALDYFVFTGVLPVVAVGLLAPVTTRERLRAFAVGAWIVAMSGTFIAATQPTDGAGFRPGSQTGWLIGMAVMEAASLFAIVQLDERRRDQADQARAANRSLLATNAELARAEARSRELFDANPIPMWLYDVATLRFIAVNDAAVAKYGWGREEFLSLTVGDLVVEEQPGSAAGGPAAGHPGDPVRAHFRHRTRDGALIEVESRSASMVFEGRAVEAVAVTDVSERELLAAERDVLLDLSADMVFVGDARGTILRAGRAVHEALGYTADQLRDMTFVRLVHPEDRGITIATFRRLRAGERVTELEVRFRTAAGDYRRLSWRAACDVDRRMIYAAARDVTEIRALEEQHGHGERMRAVGRLAGGVAHDFNNLVTAIAGHAAFAAAAVPPGSQALADIEAIQTSTLRAQALTSQLLAFGRPVPGSPRRTSFREVVTRLEPMLRRLIHENIVFEVRHIEPDVPIVVDSDQIERVIVNLVANARDAMPSGGRLEIVTSMAREGREGREMACLEVRDTGSGMSPEVRARIFEPFFTTKPVGKGTGLGLASAYGMVSLAGGRVDVDSVPGGGSTFRVLMPEAPDGDGLLPGGSDAAAGQRDGESADRGMLTALLAGAKPGADGGATILVVEDEATIRRLAARVLIRAGYRVLVAEHATEALAIAGRATTDIDLVFSDVVMPGRSGRDLVRELQAGRPGLRILLTSGYEEQPEPGGPHATPFIAKPYEPATLVSRVREVLGQPGRAP